MHPTLHHTHRLNNIALARQEVIENGAAMSMPWVESWVERSWRRCLSWGQNPQQAMGFESVSQAQIRQLQELNRPLLQAAQAELDKLSRAISGTRYFALLTDAQGVVIATRGDIDQQDPRARDIARVGVNLSEQSIGTTAIGAVLAEQRPIWLHRGEHFFDSNHAYSCAGAPLFNPLGECIGMLDLTGIDVPERPELQHLAAQAARSIENTWIRQSRPTLLLNINWAGQISAHQGEGLIGLDADGVILCANQQARQIMGLAPKDQPHASDVFAATWQSLFDMSAKTQSLEMPLWSGLRVQVQSSCDALDPTDLPAQQPLKAVENDLIARAMRQARGNVTEAARRLGISRATLYRKISPSKNSGK